MLIALSFMAVPTGAHADTLADRLRASFAKGELPGLHGAIIDLGDTRLAEVYFTGEDQRWGVWLGPVQHGAETLHDLRSVTKSIVALLYGIALADGNVPAPNESLYAQFPEYPDLMTQPGRDRILIRHALTMQMGLEWNEDIPYSDPRNSEIAMERATDRYRYILEQPIREAPGENWIYSGGAVALLAKLIESGTGMPVDAFAKQRLFDPLGIRQFDWVAGMDGTPSAASGLRLTLPDLAKIGHMIARGGLYKGRRIVPGDWLEVMLQPRVTLDRHTKYGFLWYIAGRPETPVAVAVGLGGQRLSIQPNRDLVVAVSAGRYNDPLSWQTSLKVVLDFAVPEAKKRLAD